MRQHGKFKTSLNGHKVFCPDPLPPSTQFSSEVLSLAEEATHSLGKVAMCRNLIPNADIMINTSLMKEAIASSTIEGTVASPDDLMLFDLGRVRDERPVREVANYRKALETGCHLLGSEPLTLKLILHLHSILMDGVRGQENRGRWKTTQNYIAPSSNSPIEEALFTPASPEETPLYLNDLEKYINLPQREPKVIQCALVHHQFETIHPFGDGNGRVGRLMIVLHLIQLGLLQEPLIYPSVYFERTRSEYVQGLQDVRFKGDWNGWVRYFVKGVIAQCDMTIEFVHRCRSLQTDIKKQIPSVRLHASVDRVLDCFFADLVWTMPEICADTKLSFNAVKSAIQVLEELKIVEQIEPEQKRNKAYFCRPVFNVLFHRQIA